MAGPVRTPGLPLLPQARKPHADHGVQGAWRHFPDQPAPSGTEAGRTAGVATHALEIFDELPEPDVIRVPVGVGSGICGTGLVAAQRRPSTRVIGIQSEGAPAVTLSWRQGRPVETESPRTFAEGMATRMPAAMTLALIRRHVHNSLLVGDVDLHHATPLLLRATHNQAEGPAAA